MIGRLNHIAIAVRDIASATAIYRDTLGASVTEAVEQPAHGVTTVFVELPNTKIELLEPLGEDSPINRFLERNADGGIHHLCYEVEDILAARDRTALGSWGTVNQKPEPTVNLCCFYTRKISAAPLLNWNRPEPCPY